METRGKSLISTCATKSRKKRWLIKILLNFIAHAWTWAKLYEKDCNYYDANATIIIILEISVKGLLCALPHNVSDLYAIPWGQPCVWLHPWWRRGKQDRRGRGGRGEEENKGMYPIWKIVTQQFMAALHHTVMPFSYQLDQFFVGRRSDQSTL